MSNEGQEASDLDTCQQCGLQVTFDEKGFCPECGKRTIHQDPNQQNSEANSPSSDGLFSEGFFGLLEKGPIGWILFGLIGGILYGAYKTLMGEN